MESVSMESNPHLPIVCDQKKNAAEPQNTCLKTTPGFTFGRRDLAQKATEKSQKRICFGQIWAWLWSINMPPKSARSTPEWNCPAWRCF